MHVFEFAFLIVLVVTIGKLIERRMDRRYGPQQDDEGETAAPDAGRIDALEQRVQVLERIVTDQGYELRQKFRELDD